jgi:hypothetical protein
MFTIVTVSLQDEGNSLLEEVSGSYARLHNMHQAFQMMLANHWARLKKERFCGLPCGG